MISVVIFSKTYTNHFSLRVKKYLKKKSGIYKNYKFKKVNDFSLSQKVCLIYK